MIFDLETYELIDRYLKGLVSGEEKILFEKQQNENPAFAEEVELQILINELVLEKGLADIRAKVGEDLSDAKNVSWFKTAILCTGVICLVTGGVLYYSSKEKTNSKELKEVGGYNNEHNNVHSNEQSTVSIVPLKEVQKNKNTFERNVGLKKEDTLSLVSSNTGVAVRDRGLKQVVVVDTTTTTTTTLVDSPKENKIKIMEPVSQQEPCGGIIFEVNSEASCLQKQTGKIQILISSIKGGSKPYAYSIGGNDFSLESINQMLGKGDYLVQVKDNKGCISEKQIRINEKSCVEFIDYSFNPQVETWKFPLNEFENGAIVITDISGRVIYSNKIASSDSWNGRSLNGDIQLPGSYLYIIESNGIKIKQGYITIFY